LQEIKEGIQSSSCFSRSFEDTVAVLTHTGTWRTRDERMSPNFQFCQQLFFFLPQWPVARQLRSSPIQQWDF